MSDSSTRGAQRWWVDVAGDVVDGPTDDLRRLTTVIEHLTPEQVTGAISGPAIERSGPFELVRAGLAGDDTVPVDDLADVVHVARRDVVAGTLSGALGRFTGEAAVDALSGLVAFSRLGPFVTETGLPAWFDLFTRAEQLVVRLDGAPPPALVLQRARRARRISSNVRLDAGTLWIRSDLVAPGAPPDSYVGIVHAGGSVDLGQVAAATPGVLDVVSPFVPRIKLDLLAGTAAARRGGCSSSGASITLPASVTISVGPGRAPTVTGPDGSATAWGQTFTFSAPSVERAWLVDASSWTVTVPFDVAPATFDVGAIPTDLFDAGGPGAVVGGGLVLPLVATTDPTVLGGASRAGTWTLDVTGLSARWYGDARRHALGAARVDVFPAGASIRAAAVAPLTPPVRDRYELWEIATAAGHRVPWHTVHDAPFGFAYSCTVDSGEHLVHGNRVEVALDRPLAAGGSPIPTPTGAGVTALTRFDGRTAVILGAFVDQGPDVVVALENALVRTTAPPWMIAQGVLAAPREVEEGTLRVPMGVRGWVPTLPDPYVANVRAQRKTVAAHAAAGSVVTAVVTWPAPDAVEVTIAGSLGRRLAVVLAQASDGTARPAVTEPLPGMLTQVDQHATSPDPDAAKQREAARGEARRRIEEGLHEATEQNQRHLAAVDGTLRESVGLPPAVVLLDVSTNQDLLGVGLAASNRERIAPLGGEFPVDRLTVTSELATVRVVALPQVQWEPVRTLDRNQNIAELGWFPSTLASASDGGATWIGARAQRLVPIVPEPALTGTLEEFAAGTPIGVRTTFPFGLVAAVTMQPRPTLGRDPDTATLTRPRFAKTSREEATTGGIQFTARAEGGRPAGGGVSPMFAGTMRQLANGVDLATGDALGLSVLGSTKDQTGSVERVFNADMAARPRVPVTRFDIAGYGGSSSSDWNNPFAAFAEAAKVHLRYVVGRTVLEVVKVTSAWHPWGVRMTRSVTIERRTGGGVIRRDSGWQATTAGIFDYRYVDPVTRTIEMADYRFEAGMFRGLRNVRAIRPAPGTPFSSDGATFVPYFADADVALEGLGSTVPAVGVLGWLQTEPNGVPASVAALADLLAKQGPVGGPIDAWLSVGASGLPFRASRIEVGLADDAGTPLFVATVRGAPKLPTTGSWSVVRRPVAGVAPGAGEAEPIADERGVPLIRRNPVAYPATDEVFTTPPTTGTPGDHRFADAGDLLHPNDPQAEYALLQSTPCHALLFPRPFAPAGSPGKLSTVARPAIADVIARSTSKGSFPPPTNTIELAPGAVHLDVDPAGTFAIPAPIVVVDHPTPLRISGSTGHGSTLRYDRSTLRVGLDHHRWEADFTGLRVWNDIAGLAEVTGCELHVVGSTDQRPQIAEMRSLILQEIEEILAYIPFLTARGVEGPIDLGATNLKHELKFEVKTKVKFPKKKVSVSAADPEVFLELSTKAKSGIDLATGGLKAQGGLGALAEGRFPVLTVGVASVFIIVSLEVGFTIESVSGSVKSEKLELTAFAGVGVKGQIGPFKAYAYLGVGFALKYDAVSDKSKFGGLVRLEAGVDLVIVSVTIRAELKGLVYEELGSTKCDYSGTVEINVEICFFISITASYEVSDTTSF